MTDEVKGTFSPEAKQARDAFIAHKKEHPEPTPYEKLTPLQKRMQSGYMADPDGLAKANQAGTPVRDLCIDTTPPLES